MSVSAAWGVLFLTEQPADVARHGPARHARHRGVVWAPAEQLMLHDMVGREQLPSAVRLNSTVRSLGFLAGPAIGSVLLLGLGPAFGIFANVLIYLPLTIWLVRTPYTGHVRDGGWAPRPACRRSRRCACCARSPANRVLISMVALGGLSSLFIGSGMGPQMPEFAHDLGIDQAGLVYGALRGGERGRRGARRHAAGEHARPAPERARRDVQHARLEPVHGRLRRSRSSYPLSLALLVLAGVANLASTSMAQTLVQLLAPAEKRGRVVGVYQHGQRRAARGQRLHDRPAGRRDRHPLVARAERGLRWPRSCSAC